MFDRTCIVTAFLLASVELVVCLLQVLFTLVQCVIVLSLRLFCCNKFAAFCVVYCHFLSAVSGHLVAATVLLGYFCSIYFFIFM